MSFFLNLKSKETQCINGCSLFNDLSQFSYWENKDATNDEIYITNYLNKKNFLNLKKILHVGIGNSYIAKNLSNFKKIDGISLSKNEIDFALKLKILNYHVFYQNKYAKLNVLNEKINFYDIIIDVNLKSFSCCDHAFDYLFHIYSKILKTKGVLITARDGMNWSRQVKPVLSFSFKKLFHKRLKEFDGPKSNLLTENDCLKLSSKYNFTLDSSDKKLIMFKKESL